MFYSQRKIFLSKLHFNQVNTVTSHRYNGKELNSVASFMGGVVAQEVIKLITRQYVPICHTFVYNGITSTTTSFDLWSLEIGWNSFDGPCQLMYCFQLIFVGKILFYDAVIFFCFFFCCTTLCFSNAFVCKAMWYI